MESESSKRNLKVKKNVFVWRQESGVKKTILQLNDQRYLKEEETKDDSPPEDDDYVPYVPVKERKKQKLTKLGRISQVKKDFES
jgi:hypothetical protein